MRGSGTPTPFQRGRLPVTQAPENMVRLEAEPRFVKSGHRLYNAVRSA